MKWLKKRINVAAQRRRSVAALIVTLIVGPCCWAAGAQQPAAIQLGLPLACSPGADCFVMNYVDHDDGPGRRDYQCRHMTYNDHRGTDFALADPSAMASGVAVLAAAPGKVVGVRDGMADIHLREGGAKAVEGRECGNGVTIDHGSGWVTSYCHLRRGSVAVRLGQSVSRGDQLGLVGLSGGTEFPQVHLGVTWRGRPIDPFVGWVEDIHTTCGPGAAPLWSKSVMDSLTYRPIVIYQAGLVPDSVTEEDVRRLRLRPAATHDAPADVVSFFFFIVGLARHDELSLRLIGPDGRAVVDRTGRFSADRFVHADRLWARSRAGALPKGIYRGEIVIVPGAGSDGETIRRSETLELR
jgi:hypothetical protein